MDGEFVGQCPPACHSKHIRAKLAGRLLITHIHFPHQLLMEGGVGEFLFFAEQQQPLNSMPSPPFERAPTIQGKQHARAGNYFIVIVIVVLRIHPTNQPQAIDRTMEWNGRRQIPPPDGFDNDDGTPYFSSFTHSLPPFATG